MTQARRTWNGGDIPTATDFNACVRDASMFGTGTTIVGTTGVTAGGGFLFQAGNVVITTNAAGGAGFNFPVPFPNGVLSVMVMCGDAGASSVGVVAGIFPQTTLTGWAGIVDSIQTGTGIVSSLVRLNYIAIGW
jgi:hypothetical protein